jgi:hypothetical protein
MSKVSLFKAEVRVNPDASVERTVESFQDSD